MSVLEHTLDIDGACAPVRLDPAATESRGIVMVLAHGAGGHMLHRTSAWQAQALCACGLDVVRFNFLYRAAGRRAPDRMPKLQACYTAAVDWARAQRPRQPVVIGGHSMGGRVGSMLAAEGMDCAGLMLFSYPLHPPGKPERLRTEHLRDIRCAVLCFSGTRDSFVTPELMHTAVDDLPTWQQHWIEGGDHSLHVLKRSGRTFDDVRGEVSATVTSWLDTAVS